MKQLEAKKLEKSHWHGNVYVLNRISLLYNLVRLKFVCVYLYARVCMHACMLNPWSKPFSDLAVEPFWSWKEWWIPRSVKCIKEHICVNLKSKESLIKLEVYHNQTEFVNLKGSLVYILVGDNFTLSVLVITGIGSHPV